MAMRAVAALVCCLNLLALARPAECAQASRLRPGARIRFDAPSLGNRLTGTVVALESDTLKVRVDGDAPGLALMIPTDSVSRIDVWRERRMTLEGAGLGILAGTLLALLASPDWVDEDGRCTTLSCIAYEVSPRLETRVAIFGGVGALAGTIIGSETKTGKWINVGTARDGGIALGVRISF